MRIIILFYIACGICYGYFIVRIRRRRSEMATLESVRELMPEAFKETVNCYGENGDVVAALIFFTTAIGLNLKELSTDDLERARLRLSIIEKTNGKIYT
jgi:hypothetical protein